MTSDQHGFYAVKGGWSASSDEKERGAEIIDAHQELVERIEQSAGRIRALSLITVVVAALLAASYLSQLVLPLTGTTQVTVDPGAPANVGSELLVLALVLVLLHLGFRDLRFSRRIRDQIGAGRSKEKELADRMSEG